MSAPSSETRHEDSAQVRDAALLQALRAGGCVLVMRHARSPQERPEPRQIELDNPGRERQLDAEGRRTAQAMGETLRRLEIPLGLVMVSPAYRTRQTAHLVTSIRPRIIPELAAADEHPKDEVGTGAGRIVWLRKAAAVAPAQQTDTLIITHAPNMLAFGRGATGLSAGETLVLRPEGQGACLIGRVRIEEWPFLMGLS